MRLNKWVAARDAVLEIELVEKYPIMNYQANIQKFLKIYCRHPNYVTKLRAFIESGVRLGTQDLLSQVTYESTMAYALRFMIDNDFGGMSWVRIQAR